MKKAIVVINGKGGIGKDTLINALARADVMVYNASSIDPIKDMCEGLNKKGVKDLAYRNLLSKVKQAVDYYYETENIISYTTEYLIKAMSLWHTQTDIHTPEYSVMFVHIREPENIAKFIKEATKKLYAWNDEDTILTSLLVESERSLEVYGNSSDDGVEDFDYEHIYESKNGINEDAECFRKMFFSEIMGMESDEMYLETKLTLTYEDLKNMLDAMHDDGLFAEGDGCNLHLRVEDEIDKAIKDGTITVHDKEHEV